MATLVSAATITTVVGTEVSALGLNPGASPGSYVYKLDVNALAAGEVLFIREYNIVSLVTANLLSAAASSFEDGTTGGWTAGVNCSVSTIGTQGLDGSHALQLSATAAGSFMAANSLSNLNAAIGAIPVAAGATYAAVAFFKTAVSARGVQIKIVWLDTNAVTIGQTFGTTPNDATGAWTGSIARGVAPVGATFAYIQALVVSPGGAAELHWVDCAEFGPVLGVNMATAAESSFETGITGTVAGTNCTVAQSGAQALDGSNSLSMTSLAAGFMNANTPTGTAGFPVWPGATYTAIASFLANTVGRGCVVQVNWYQAGGSASAVRASDASPQVTDLVAGSTGWVQASITAIAPSDAAFATLTYTIATTAGVGEVHFVDCAGLIDGTSTAWIIGGSQPGGWSIGGVERLNYFGSYVAGSDADQFIETVPILVDVNSRLSLHQKNGSARAIPVKVLKL